MAMMPGLDRSRPASGATRHSVTAHPASSDHHGTPSPDAAACAVADTAVQTAENAADLSSLMPPSARVVSLVVSLVVSGRMVYYEP
jgi:hypothetical protein